ncbi:hypothetical protein Gmet_0356 [Geobacter metallireducens GS-15]|uniref:Uncharacterized protein n=1 Tax=Geobacter metallireducens (strain ATCC 53774 / DSM 7210 / GS-15) TaxID=269799 RepID=Q39YS5_GEOMG|nr:hypothetical protein [Geobacter metallireducens]ABB30599.1 hypothetical protein Gmet_0356 [Geobacter metallireducens GS-15]
MTPALEPAPTQPVRRRTLACILACVALFILFVPVAFKLYLTSPQAASHLSRLLTDSLRSPVTVAALETRGGTVVIRGLSVANPPGFSAAPLAVVDTLAITPRWFGLLWGDRRFSRIEIRGARVVAEKNRGGVWNVVELQRRLPKKRSPARETRIDELILRSWSMTVEGRSVAGIAFRIRDLATRGSTDSRLDLAFADGAGNRYRIEGNARPGPASAFDLMLTAPSLTLAPLADVIKRHELFLEQGTGALRLRVALEGGVLRADGIMDFGKIAVRGGKGTLLLAGRVNLRGDYDPRRDEAHVTSLAITLADLATARVAAKVNRVRKERAFSADVSLDEVDLKRLSPLVAAVTGRPLSLAGQVGSRNLHVAGDGARGMIAIEGGGVARDVVVSLGGRLLVKGGEGIVSLASAPGGILAKGTFSTPRNTEDALVEKIELPFALLLTPRFKPLDVQVPSLAARIMGVPLTGHLSFRPGSQRPLLASLHVPSTSLVLFSPYLSRYGLRPTSGTTSLALDLQGKGAADFDGEAAIRVDSLAAEVQGKRAILGTGEVHSRFKRSGEHLSATGTARLDGAEFNGNGGGISTTFSFADRSLTLEDVRGSFAATMVSAGRATLTLPAVKAGAAPEPRPLLLQLAGGAVRRGDVEATGLSASLRGSLHADPKGRWFEGGGAVFAERLALRGAPVGAPSLRFTLSRSAGEVDLGGKLLDGTMSGQASFDPRSPATGASFSLGVKDGKLALARTLLPGKQPVVPADGLVSGTVAGSFARAGGLSARIDLRADGVALAGEGGKRLLSGGGARIAGRVEGERVVLQESSATFGEGATLRLQGEMERVLSPQRAGRLTFSLPATPLDRLIDPVVNALPRFIQEATVAGSVAAEGTAVLKGKGGGVDGTLTFDGVSLDVPSQKLLVSGVHGTVPFSLESSPGTYRRARDEVGFTKENFTRLLEQFRQTPTADRTLTVGKLRFGPLELGETTAFLRSANGVVELTSLRSGLSGGEVLGRGFVAMKGGLAYGCDILVYDLSLRRFCDAIPKIKGYVSGRLDGIASLKGAGKGIAGLDGITDLWVRNTKGEKMLLSKEFLQRLAGKKLKGFFFRDDRPFDRGEVSAYLEEGYLTFTTLDISHTNLLGMRDLSVTVAPVQNRIAIDHLFSALKEAATRGKAVSRGDEAPAAEPPVQTDFQWRD